jgi:hypothetical protein
MDMPQMNESQKDAMDGLAEVLSKPTAAPAKPAEGSEPKDPKTKAQERLLAYEATIKEYSVLDLDITELEIDYLQARTAFAMGNLNSAKDYLDRIESGLLAVKDKAEAKKKEKAEASAVAPAPAPPPMQRAGPVAPMQVEGTDEIAPEDMPTFFCMHCGDKITKDSVFCNWCGKKVS